MVERALKGDAVPLDRFVPRPHLPALDPDAGTRFALDASGALTAKPAERAVPPISTLCDYSLGFIAFSRLITAPFASPHRAPDLMLHHANVLFIARTMDDTAALLYDRETRARKANTLTPWAVPDTTVHAIVSADYAQRTTRHHARRDR